MELLYVPASSYSWRPRISKLWWHKRFDRLAPMMQKIDLCIGRFLG